MVLWRDGCNRCTRSWARAKTWSWRSVENPSRFAWRKFWVRLRLYEEARRRRSWDVSGAGKRRIFAWGHWKKHFELVGADDVGVQNLDVHGVEDPPVLRLIEALRLLDRTDLGRRRDARRSFRMRSFSFLERSRSRAGGWSWCNRLAGGGRDWETTWE
jgi:hypothetical protein